MTKEYVNSKFKNEPRVGDLVLIPFPFTDLSSEKVRPALIMGEYLENVTVLFITRKYRAGEYSIQIRQNTDNGLKHDSTILASKISTLDKKMMIGRIGFISESDLNLVKGAIKFYFDL
jgi:mRNA interferase MazF